MHYKVTARFITDTAAEFLKKLTDGTIERQRPDGKEIVQSMTTRARIDDQGIVRWSEVCYCPTPLEHEQETVYHRFFTDLETKVVEDYVEINDGEPFIEYLQRQVDESRS